MSWSQIISLSVILKFAQTYSLWGGLGYVPVGQVDILSCYKINANAQKRDTTHMNVLHRQ